MARIETKPETKMLMDLQFQPEQWQARETIRMPELLYEILLQTQAPELHAWCIQSTFRKRIAFTKDISEKCNLCGCPTAMQLM